MAIIIVLCSPFDVLAAPISGDSETPDHYVPYVQREEERALEQEKWKEAAVITQRRNLVTAKALDITCFMQETDYRCGVATTKQVLHYLNGTSLTQGEYAKALGTTTSGTAMPNIYTYLNAHNSTYTYSFSDNNIGTKEHWETIIMADTIKDIPAVMDINSNGVSGFPYLTTGHFVNSSGYNPKNKTVRISDPINNTAYFGNKWYSVDSLYNSNNQHFRKDRKSVV